MLGAGARLGYPVRHRVRTPDRHDNKREEPGYGEACGPAGVAGHGPDQGRVSADVEDAPVGQEKGTRMSKKETVSTEIVTFYGWQDEHQHFQAFERAARIIGGRLGSAVLDGLDQVRDDVLERGKP